MVKYALGDIVLKKNKSGEEKKKLGTACFITKHCRANK